MIGRAILGLVLTACGAIVAGSLMTIAVVTTGSELSILFTLPG